MRVWHHSEGKHLTLAMRDSPSERLTMGYLAVAFFVGFAKTTHQYVS